MSEFRYTELLPVAKLDTPYRLISSEGFEVIELGNRKFLKVFPETLAMITEVALRDIQHLLRPGHLQQIANILADPEASANDRFVALDLLKNANVSAGGVLPMCQDTGTVLVSAKRGPQVITDALDEEWISKGIFNAYQNLNLRYSQVSPLSMWEEKNTGTNLPAQIEINLNTKPGHELEYELFYIAKGGGSANKSFLFQETKALLNPKSFIEFLDEKLRMIGTSACPPYHLAIVIGGTSAE
ncbi:MAG: fumarate hydratase, partial [Candidatus Nanopelagicales bacterium]